MRKAFVGLSTPIGYDYKNGLENKFGKPNPIIDSPMGLFLFYDEIWFINRKTCPINCENLRYVKFLDEEYDLTKLELERFDWENIKLENDIEEGSRDKFWKNWESTLKINLGKNIIGVDNHSRGIDFGTTFLTPNPTALNLVIDDFLASHFNLELITNSATSVYAESTAKSSIDLTKSKLTQLILCDNIPNFHLPHGPYHSFIEDLRSESLLKQYRKKINEIIRNPNEDISELTKEINSAMETYLYELILKNLNKNQIFKGAFNAGIGQVPILGNIYSGYDGGKTIYDNIMTRKEYGWMGFVAKARLFNKK